MDGINNNYNNLDSFEQNKDIEEKDEKPSLIELQEMTTSTKITQAKLLASKLNYPLPPLTQRNVDEILMYLRDESDAMSLKEKRERGINIEDTRLGDTTETMTFAALTDNDALFGAVFGDEQEEDTDDKSKLKLMDEADSKGVKYFESHIHQGEDIRIKEKIKIGDQFEEADIDHLLDSNGNVQVSNTDLENMNFDHDQIHALGEANINVELGQSNSKNQLGNA
ncbi:MAG: hypothetical protein HRT47_11935 [Candidatus Caenarcaniphilales bacterium]|nr:hypothetical protein [Candidatus Caenarcaniphilales bacterium]